MGTLGRYALALAFCAAACGGHRDSGVGNQPPPVTPPPSNPGTPDPPPPPPDPQPPPGPKFGGKGPWPLGNVIYGAADGIAESPVVGVTTDESQNLWVATSAALYLLRPGDTKFTRFDGHSGLHLAGFPVDACDDSQGTLKPCPSGDADPMGINEIVGGGFGAGYDGEVFVGYWAHHDWTRADDGTETDPFRHSGKLDRVRLKIDASGHRSLDVIRFDMVSNNSVEFWHNKDVFKMVYDHFKHPHELYVGANHGVDKFSPDKWKPNDPPPNQWFLLPNNSQVWRSDHLHPQACYHTPCVNETGLRLSDWRGLALDANGDLWVAGRYAAGLISYVEDNRVWYDRGGKSYLETWGDPYYGNCSGSRPVFCTPLEGDKVNLSAVTVTKDGTVWFASGILFGEPDDVNYGIAAHVPRKGFTYYDPVKDAGLPEMTVRDLLALPDGRLVVAGASTGLSIWDPASGKHVNIRAGQGIPDDHVLRVQLDTMVDPPALQVATRGGAAVLRVLP